MKNRAPALGAALLLCIAAGLVGLSATASATFGSIVKKPSPSPSPSPSPPPSAATFVKAYAALAGSSELNLTPLDTQSTSDGGYIALSQTETSAGLGVDWLLKLSATGVPQWQEQVGCASPQGAPGDYADGASVEQTADGGYIVGGQTIDCGSGTSCPALSGRSCAIVEKFDPAGKLSWARVYAAGAGGSGIDQIRQTADGGYIAAGSFTDASQDTGALLLKLDSTGNVQWQKDLGPAGTTGAYFNTVEQTADGGYVAAGAFYVPTVGTTPTQALVARFGSDGSLAWQHGFATVDGSGATTSVADVSSIVQTSDGGYAAAGRWYDQTFNGGSGARGALLLKLDSTGTLQWQQVYSGGVYCSSGGYGQTCSPTGAISYSLHQASDGGYILAGDGDLELTGSVYLVPWLAKADASGNLLWQHFYYQGSPQYGTPLSHEFQDSALAPDGGFIATAATMKDGSQDNELYAVRTDSSGLAGTCADIHPATALQAISPQLTVVAPSLPLVTASTQAASSPVATTTTSVATRQDC